MPQPSYPFFRQPFVERETQVVTRPWQQWLTEMWRRGVGEEAIAHTHVASAVTDLAEATQDIVGAFLTDSSTIDFTYNDPGNTATAVVKPTSITPAHVQHVAANRLLGRNPGSAGPYEELTPGTGLALSGTTLNVTLSGGVTRSISSISGNTTGGAAALTDYIYLCTATLTFTLPTAVGNTNVYTVKNTGSGTVTVNTTSSQTIDGSTSLTMPVQFTSLSFVSNNANWSIV